MRGASRPNNPFKLLTARVRAVCSKRIFLNFLLFYVVLTVILFITFSNVDFFRRRFTVSNIESICQQYPSGTYTKLETLSGTNEFWGDTRHEWFAGSAFATNIFQAFRSTEDLTPAMEAASDTFKNTNPGWGYNFFSAEEMDAFVNKFYPEIHTLYTTLPEVIKSDLFRYLVIYEKGGLYADIEAKCLTPIWDWQGSCGSELISVVIGVECEHEGCDRQPQFSQWIFLFAARHPLMKYIIEKVLLKIKQTEKITAAEAAEISGPGVWTDAIFEYLEKSYGILNFVKSFPTPVKKLVGDILILPSHEFHGAYVQHRGGRSSWRPLPSS